MKEEIGLRIKKLMEKENLSPGEFSEMVGIQRSAVSHLVTGRNKPSLEVIQKILNTFRTLHSDWLILGVAPMYRGERQSHELTLFDQIEENADKQRDTPIQEAKKTIPENIVEKNIPTQAVENSSSVSVSLPVMPQSKLVNKIIVYYSDSTYEEFNKEK